MSSTILQRVAEGDMAAVRNCIEQYSGLVWSLARRLLANAAEAEDAVQEVFIELWKSASRFDPNVASEPAFIAMVARRRLIDRRRRLSRRLDNAASVPLDEIDVESDPDAGPGLEIAEEATLADNAIRTLKPEQQRILRLAVCDGWSHQQIADTLHMPLGTVKTHVRRGLIRVRELLNPEQSQPSGRDAQ
ncbi:MAG: RNA polymerase sigma factor [Phycisphaerales bacterium]|nr:RNA polymerase sigma factor [Phycisphaerales bacterium]MCB9858566.1 RNA polymerase sigma factor [Phycisphaerales bacterium]